jgi:hypothetical protein
MSLVRGPRSSPGLSCFGVGGDALCPEICCHGFRGGGPSIMPLVLTCVWWWCWCVAVDIVDYLKNKSRYVAIGARLPKGVLLSGQPNATTDDDWKPWAPYLHGSPLLRRRILIKEGAPCHHG